MRILVTGAAGFIGSHTVDALLKARFHDVIALDNLSTGKAQNLNPNARFYQADVRDRDAIDALFAKERPEILVHLAAQIDVRRSVKNPLEDCEINLVGLLNLMEAGRRNGLKRVVFASSGGAIYGEQKVFPCAEDHPCQPVSPYGVAKLASEAYLHFYHVEYGIEYVSLRYANVYGPRQDPHGEAGVVAIFCSRLLSGTRAVIFGSGEQTRDYVFVDDVVRANLAALDKGGPAAVVNIGTGVETSVNHLYQTLAELAGVKAAPVYDSPRPGEQMRSAISPALARQLLDWQPRTTLYDGLKRTLEYYRSLLSAPGATDTTAR